MSGYCVFCEIIAKREPARIEYEDDDVIVFRNVLTWVPVMLLAVPKQHMMQWELWGSDLMSKVGAIAVEQGAKLCPRGFRLLSNFGTDAMQSQPHAHVHVVGGMFLGEYV
jgi:histidine triad (HIT) family protein